MASRKFIKPAKSDQDLRWARIWFRQLAVFHKRANDPTWNFTPEELIAFLQSKRDQGFPAWKRMGIIEGARRYRESVAGLSTDGFGFIHAKMKQIVATERARQEGPETIEEAAGSIDSSEPDAIQAFRRAMRATGLALKTERSYVGKVRAFMKTRSLKSLADFDLVQGSHVEAHLTDLAVDGNVAPSTQNQAFHALLRDAPLVVGDGYSSDSRIARAQRFEDNDDLHACAEQESADGNESTGSIARAARSQDGGRLNSDEQVVSGLQCD